MEEDSLVEQIIIEIEATSEGTVIEIIRVADPKDLFGVRTLIREWLDERYYRDVEEVGDPLAI